MPTYYCSDPHAFHGNIMKYCRRIDFMTPEDRAAFLDLEARGGDLAALRVGDESIDRMNRALAENINARVEARRHPLVPGRLGVRPGGGLPAERPMVPRPDPVPGRPARLGEPRRPLDPRPLHLDPRPGPGPGRDSGRRSP